MISWKKQVGWWDLVATVRVYLSRGNHKHGSPGTGKATKVIDSLCSDGASEQAALLAEHALTVDDLATILSNVTIAIQERGSVHAPEEGGWYMALEGPRRYVVSPGFAAAWLGLS